MKDFLLVLGLALLPALSNLIGGLLGEILPFSQRTLSLSLHGSIGVLLAVICVKLMPMILEARPSWVTLLPWTVGGILFVYIDYLVKLAGNQLNLSNQKRKPWIIFFSMSIHLLQGGLMIGTSATIERNLGVLIALARFIAHFPQGFSIISEFKQARISRPIRLLVSLSFFIPMCLGATIGYWLVSDRPLLLKLGILAFTTGTLTTAVVEEIIPEAHQQKDTDLSILTFVISFALFSGFLTHFN